MLRESDTTLSGNAAIRVDFVCGSTELPDSVLETARRADAVDGTVPRLGLPTCNESLAGVMS